MKSGMTVVRADARYRQLVAVKKAILDKFASNSTTKCRAVTKVARTILLNAPYLLNGRYYEVKAKSLGAGVYELSLEAKDE